MILDNSMTWVIDLENSAFEMEHAKHWMIEYIRAFYSKPKLPLNPKVMLNCWKERAKNTIQNVVFYHTFIFSAIGSIMLANTFVAHATAIVWINKVACIYLKLNVSMEKNNYSIARNRDNEDHR